MDNEHRISLKEVQAALQRCMRERPPQGYVLDRDASLIADVFADMLYLKEGHRPVAAIRADRMDAIRRWAPPGEAT